MNDRLTEIRARLAAALEAKAAGFTHHEENQLIADLAALLAGVDEMRALLEEGKGAWGVLRLEWHNDKGQRERRMNEWYDTTEKMLREVHDARH